VIVIFGAGSWGLAFAGLASASSQVRLVCRTKEQAAALSRSRQDDNYLPGFSLPKAVEVTHLGDLAAAADASLIVLAAPSKAT
jgi:glycerol-3-phosphate dehydrogenase (NAD(P)+)